jgi:hypothetical protein
MLILQISSRLLSYQNYYKRTAHWIPWSRIFSDKKNIKLRLWIKRPSPLRGSERSHIRQERREDSNPTSNFGIRYPRETAGVSSSSSRFAVLMPSPLIYHSSRPSEEVSKSSTLSVLLEWAGVTIEKIPVTLFSTRK